MNQITRAALMYIQDYDETVPAGVNVYGGFNERSVAGWLNPWARTVPCFVQSYIPTCDVGAAACNSSGVNVSHQLYAAIGQTPTNMLVSGGGPCNPGEPGAKWSCLIYRGLEPFSKSQVGEVFALRRPNHMWACPADRTMVAGYGSPSAFCELTAMPHYKAFGQDYMYNTWLVYNYPIRIATGTQVNGRTVRRQWLPWRDRRTFRCSLTRSVRGTVRAEARTTRRCPIIGRSLLWMVIPRAFLTDSSWTPIRQQVVVQPAVLFVSTRIRPWTTRTLSLISHRAAYNLFLCCKPSPFSQDRAG